MQSTNPSSRPIPAAAAPITDLRAMFTRQRARSGPGRSGFTFVELIVGLAIMVMIASVVAPAVLSTLDATRVSTAASALADLQKSIEAFADTVNDYPQSLAQLTTPITGAQTNLCATANYTTTGTTNEVTSWANQGPFSTRIVGTAGAYIGIGRAKNLLARLPAAGNLPTSVIIQVDSVSVDDGYRLGLKLDGDTLSGGGFVQWTGAPNADGLLVLNYTFGVVGAARTTGGACQ
jgi:prepilin-type N-terminal cleavage/methylation domain-containing protein